MNRNPTGPVYRHPKSPPQPATVHPGYRVSQPADVGGVLRSKAGFHVPVSKLGRVMIPGKGRVN